MQAYSVLFVCLGNICRSPLAKGIMRDLVAKRSLVDHVHVDSCGTGGWHIGEGAHQETVRVARGLGVELEGHRARQLQKADFDKFDLLVAMDSSNQREMLRIAGDNSCKVVLLREYDPSPSSLDVPDPFYGGEDGFLEVQDIVFRSCERLLTHIEQQLSCTTLPEE